MGEPAAASCRATALATALAAAAALSSSSLALPSAANTDGEGSSGLTAEGGGAGEALFQHKPAASAAEIDHDVLRVSRALYRARER